MSVTSRTIEMHRMLTEEGLVRILKEAEAVVTVDEVKTLIFEADISDFRAYLMAILTALDREDIDSIDDATLRVVQDAWNYFPHRTLNGRCPAEIMEENLRRRKA